MVKEGCMLPVWDTMGTYATRWDLNGFGWDLKGFEGICEKYRFYPNFPKLSPITEKTFRRKMSTEKKMENIEPQKVFVKYLPTNITVVRVFLFYNDIIS